MSKDYLTIAEYAKIRGVSVSAVYKRISTTLKPFIVRVEGGKMGLKSEVLDFENLRDSNEGYSPFSPTLDDTIQPSTFDEILKEKDRQIEELRREVERLKEECRKKDDFILENSQKIITLLEQAQELQRNNQVIIARQQEMKQLEDGKRHFLGRLFGRRKNKEEI